MGQTPSTNKGVNNTPSDKSNTELKFLEDENYKKMSEILDTCNELINKFKNQDKFLQEDFCNKIQLAYIPKLAKMNVDDLAEMYNNLYSSGESFQLAIPIGKDKVEISSFKKSLKKHPFTNDSRKKINKNNIILEFNYLPFKQNKGQLSYIKNTPKINKTNQQMGGDIQNTVSTPIQNPIKVSNQIQSSSPNVIKLPTNPPKSPYSPDLSVIKSSSNDIRTKNSINKPKPQISSNDIMEKNSMKKEIEIDIKQLKKEQNNVSRITEKIEKKLTLFENCKENSQKCLLSKFEICKKITEHYLYRLNILQAIYHVLPRKTSDNKFINSFYYNRILSLKNGNMCLPKNIGDFKNSTTEQKIKYINEIMNRKDISNKTCVRGTYKTEYTEDDLKKFTEDSKFSEIHHRIRSELEKEYILSIESLYHIILKLKTEKIINNDELYETGELAKNTIDTMYYNAQYFYVMAVINYITYNF